METDEQARIRQALEELLSLIELEACKRHLNIKSDKTSVLIKGVSMPIYRSDGQSVRNFIKQTLMTLFDKELLPAHEILRMQDLHYCQETFGIEYPLLEKDIRKIVDHAGYSWYWKKFKIGKFYVYSQWWNLPIYDAKIASWLVVLEKTVDQGWAE